MGKIICNNGDFYHWFEECPCKILKGNGLGVVLVSPNVRLMTSMFSTSHPGIICIICKKMFRRFEDHNLQLVKQVLVLLYLGP